MGIEVPRAWVLDEISEKDACGNYPVDKLAIMQADFYACKGFDFDKVVKKLRGTGFFGLGDKSNCFANSIMDMHYLYWYLEQIHYQKIEDAKSCGSQCQFSLHPKHYISTYKLDCIFEYFRCKGIDISCHLKAMNIHMLYMIDGHNVYVGTPNYVFPNIEFVAPETMYAVGEEVPEGDPEPMCRYTAATAADSDWLYEQLVAFTECTEDECNALYTFNEDEGEQELQLHTFNLNENFNCTNSYTFNLNEENCQ
jgi:hypothetical protein